MPARFSASSTPSPKPPMAADSSAVTTRRLPGRVLGDQRLVERLGPAGVDDGGSQAVVGLELGGNAPAAAGRSARSPPAAGRRPSRSTSPRPIGSASPTRSAQVLAGVARVEQRHGPGVARAVTTRSRSSCSSFGEPIDQVRQRPHGGQHEHPLVRRAVLADQAGSVKAEEHRHVVLADVMDEPVEGALAEGRVQRHDRPQAGERQAGGHASPRAARRCRRRGSDRGSGRRSARGRCRSACRR